MRSDNFGVTSIVRALSLDPERCYSRLQHNCHSTDIDLPTLSETWTRLVFKLFGRSIERDNGRIILIADGKKTAKSGKRMPAVKSLFQESDSNTRPAFIMGHSTQAISVLARAADNLFAPPLDINIYEGLIFSNRDKRTLLDMLLSLVTDA